MGKIAPVRSCWDHGTDKTEKEMKEVRGIVKLATLTTDSWFDKHYNSADRLELELENKEGVYEVRGFTMPRIDKGEEVLLHLDHTTVVALQIIKNDEAIYRMIRCEIGSFPTKYYFSDEK